MKNLLMLSILLCSLVPKSTKAQVITTFAGTYNGDGLTAKAIGLNATGTATDASGNTYIAVPDRHLVMKLSASGVYSTYAGNGIYGSSGDNGKASAAQFKSPWSVAIDKSGNLYIADNLDNRVRKVSPTGIVTRIVGSSPGFAGDGGLATSARINSPVGVTVDDLGNVFIADYGNRRVRKVNTAGIITTVAGKGVAGTGGDGGLATAASLGYVTSVAVNSLGEIFIADNTYGKIRKVSTTGIISSFAGTGASGYSGDGGKATLAKFNAINGIAVDKAGVVYVADSYNNRVRKIATNGIVTTIAGTGGTAYSGDGGAASAAQVPKPVNVNIDKSGNLLIAANFRIRLLTFSTGIITTLAGNGTGGYAGDNGPIAKAQLYHAVTMSVDAAGNTYFADRENQRVRKITPGGTISTIAGNGQTGYSGDGGPATSAKLYWPLAVVADAAGNVYIADNNNQRIRKVDTKGIITTIAGTGKYGFSGDGTAATAQISGPDGMTIDANGTIYFADMYNNRIRKISNGIITTVAGNGTAGFSGDGGQAKAAKLNWPKAVAVDRSGNLYIADRRNFRIRKVTVATGVITTIAGAGVAGYSGDGGAATAAKFDPGYVAVDQSGNIFIADTDHDKIRKVTVATGIIETYAGNGKTYGDGGAPALAQIRTPTCVATSSTGGIFIVEYDNHRLRKVTMGTGTGLLGRTAPATAAIYSDVRFSVYPSPVVSVLNIQVGSGTQVSAVEIIDASGRIMLSKKVIESQQLISIPVQHLTRGAYFVKVIDKNNLVTMKEIIKD